MIMKIAGEQLKTLETGKYAKNAIDIVGKQQRQKTNHFFERKMYKTCNVKNGNRENHYILHTMGR